MPRSSKRVVDISVARATQRIRGPVCIWLTGLSGAGKSTIAHLLARRLIECGQPACVLDGDDLRKGLNRDLGFSDAHRTENVRRVAEVARLMVNAGVVPIVALISPFHADRVLARSRFAVHEFSEIFVDAPLTVCEQRDPKGLYAKARRGQLDGFTGIDSPYEPPPQPDLHLNTDAADVAQCVEQIVNLLGF